MTYAFEQADTSRFAIGPGSGEIIYQGLGEDFEVTDRYLLTVKATDPKDVSAFVPVTVRIGNIDEPGIVTLAPPVPLVGHPVTATINDPDGGIKNERWQWHLSEDGVDWVVIPGVRSNRYTPRMEDFKLKLRARATYSDVHGSSIDLEGTTPEPVKVSEEDRTRTMRLALGALGRTIAASAVDMVGERVESAASSHAILGGQRLGTGDGRFPPQRVSSTPRSGPAGQLDKDGEHSPHLSKQQLISSSSFQLALHKKEQAVWTLWGRTAFSGFAGQPRADDYTMEDGRVLLGYLGIDYRQGTNALAGVALVHSGTKIGYGDPVIGRGDVEANLTKLYPYVRWAPRAGLDLWGLVGMGEGEAQLLVNSEPTDVQMDIGLRLAALGARNLLATVHGVGLAAKMDAYVVQIKPEKGPEPVSVKGAAQRVRLILEGKRDWPLTPESRLRSSLEIAARWDEGDAETGLGAEVGGGLTYAHQHHGLDVEFRGRRLLVHRETTFKDWASSFVLRLAPGDRRGLGMELAPAWGTVPNNAETLWRGDQISMENRSSSSPLRTPDRMDFKFGYGLKHSAGLVTPFAEVGLRGTKASRLRLGARLGANSSPGQGSRRLEVFGEQLVHSGASTGRRIGLRATLTY